VLNQHMRLEVALPLGPVRTVRAVEGDRVGAVLGVDMVFHVPRV
jgi:hypothetical protein